MTSEQQIRFQFLEEAEDYLNQIESVLLGISSEANINKARLDSLLRELHSIKGGAAMMGYKTLSVVAHRLEDFFKVIRSHKLPKIDSTTEQLFLVCVDRLRQCIDFYRQGQQTIDQDWLDETINPVLTQLKDLLGDPVGETFTPLEVDNSSEDTVNLIFQTEINSILFQLESQLSQEEPEKLKKDILLTAQQFAELGTMLELNPLTELSSSIFNYLEEAQGEQINWIAGEALKAWRQTQIMILSGEKTQLPCKLDLDVFTQEILPIESTTTIVEAINPIPVILPEEREFIAVPELLTAELPATAILSENSEQTIRIPLRQLEEVSNYLSELIIERNGINLQLQSFQALLKLLSNRVKRLEQSNEELRKAYDQSNWQTANGPAASLKTSPSSIFDILEMDRYSTIHPVLQELMETIVQIQEVDKDLEYNFENTQRIARDLSRTSQLMQTKLTNLRMRPISDLFGRLPRALRDLELRYGKQVDLKISGGQTLVDRPVLEALNEPLLHLVRNAFDHGIERPESRMAQNKPAKGTISISAAYRGNQTLISIEDDGQGVDLAKVRQKALEMGITEADLVKSSQADLLELLFTPGFSTASEVTDLSGRGVGLDVVRNNLESVNGRINIETEAGQGTSFTISVPLTLSIIRILLVESAGVILSIPTNAVEEIILSRKVENIVEAGQELIKWEGKTINLIRLNQWLHCPRLPYSTNTLKIPTVNEPIILIVPLGNRQVALQLDRFWGEQEVTIRQVEGLLTLPPGLLAGTILSDGRVAPLVDTIELVRWIERSQNSAAVPLVERTKKISEETLSAMVMVVDDSINVRRFLALTLEKAGYRVQQAKDGQEALERLEDNKGNIQAVVCDVEMPRLDGYGFLTQVRSQAAHHTLPVIMLTSRSGDKHRQIAMKLGATDYFSKPFLEQDLVRVLKSVIQNN